MTETKIAIVDKKTKLIEEIIYLDENYVAPKGKLFIRREDWHNFELPIQRNNILKGNFDYDRNGKNVVEYVRNFYRGITNKIKRVSNNVFNGS